MKKIAFAATALVVLADTALAAVSCPPGQVCTAVPEISALEGTAAIAAIAAVVMLVWERSRRAA
ncbi:MAG: hypothetical protein R8G34_11800 [Paracoccaceae bacterium]|nr:hypothetical protein [Paracoccaceae bacterium]